jgi:chemotaxis protein MotB
MSTQRMKRKIVVEQHEDTDSEGTWAISYGDMVTLLLTFFILFFSIEPTDNTKVKKEALKVSLVDSLRDHSKQTDKAVPTTKNNDSLSVSENPQTKEVGISKEILKVWNGVAHDMGNHIIVEFPGVSFFKSGSIDLTAEGRKSLKEFLKIYMPYAGHYQVSIRAFTDNKKVKNAQFRRFNDNLELSALRSVASLRELQKIGMPLNKMKIAGYGELNFTAAELEKIQAENRSPASVDSRSLARRVVLVIEPEEP